jgi:arylsulfatase A-like enzyme
MHRYRSIVTALLFVSACRSEPINPVRIDLLAQFRETDSRQEVLNLDLGSPAAAAALSAGWSPPAIAPTGESILWSSARKVTARATIREPHDRVLIVRAGTLASPQTRSQVVIVRVNGRRVGTMQIERELREQRMLIPARFQQRGENEIALGMRMGRGINRLPVAYDTLRIVSPESEAGPVPEVIQQKLVLPASATIEYFLRVPPQQPLLRFAVAGQAPQLQVTATTDTDAEATIFTTDGAARAAIDLAHYAGQIVRLRFISGRDGVRELQQPEVVGSRAAPGPRPMSSSRPLNVVLFLVDTLRADHLGCYGYPRATSPRIDAFARESIQFMRTVAQASWTRPATASVLTGLYPQAHGVMTLRDRLPSTVPTMAELLHARGYRTAGFVTNVNVAPAWGFQRGFDLYRYFPEDSTRPRVHAGIDEIEPQVFEWLEQNHGQPFFIYIHVTDPHAPYAPPSPFAEQLADPTLQATAEDVTARLQALKRHPNEASPDDVRALQARYDGEVALIDTYFGRLLDELARRAVDDDTVVVFTADHGEEFFDHGGFEHGRTLYTELLSIPLLLHMPQHGYAGIRSSVLARQVDVLPTVLELLDIARPPTLQGRSLLPVLQVSDDGEEALTQTSLASRDLEGLVTGPWKIVQASHRAANEAEIYNTADDPQERNDQGTAFPVLLGYARQRLAASAGHAPRQTRQDAAESVDPAIIERLRALGYSP